MIAALIRFAAEVVQQVQQGFTQQMNIVTEQAFNPMQQILQQVQNGAWKGVGADAFSEELSNLHMPGIGVIGDQVKNFQTNLQHAAEIMTKADQDANQAVQGLAEAFEKIVAF